MKPAVRILALANTRLGILGSAECAFLEIQRNHCWAALILILLAAAFWTLDQLFVDAQ